MTKPANRTNTRGDRTGEAELARRIHKVTRGMINGVPDIGLVELCEREFGVSEQTARRYIAAANEKMRECFAKVRDVEAGKALARYEDLFRLARECGDFRGAATIQDRICKLLQLWQDTIRHEAGDSLTEFLQTIRAGKATT